MTTKYNTEIKLEDCSTTSILVVDDTEINFKLICALLRKTNYQFSWARNGFDAVEKVRSGDHYDLVLMDYHMPGMNGIQAANQIKMLDKSIPFIMQTASCCDDELEQIYSNFEDVVIKPYQTETLMNKVQKYIKNQPMMVS